MKKRKRREAPLPSFCDMSCRHARFAPVASVGACRCEQAVYCNLYKKYNNKHSACLQRKH